MKEYQLVCSVCGKVHESGKEPFICVDCGGQLEPYIPMSENKEHYCEVIRSGCNCGLWDYEDMLPVEGIQQPVTLGEGNTPLISANRLANRLGIKKLFLKNETLNPSGTYKDRFASVALSIEKYKDTPAVALGSAGNAASAMSAYSAKAGMPCFVILPPGAVAERGWQVQGYGAKLIRMEHTIDDCINMAKAGEKLFGWKSLTTNMLMNPLASDGYKTIAYELGKQLSFKAPDWIVVPVGGGALLSKIYKGYHDMLELGLVDKMPRFVGAQADSCAPLADAYQRSLRNPEKWQGVPQTIAFAIADVCVYDGVTTMDAITSSKGCAIAVSDEKILDAMRMIAEHEGIIAEPASACSIACTKELIGQGTIKQSESVVCILSGSGLRDLKLFKKSQDEETPVSCGDTDAVSKIVHQFL